ncbi:hypothetical protein ACOMHN_028504 [Nucella lapillus]
MASELELLKKEIQRKEDELNLLKAKLAEMERGLVVSSSGDVVPKTDTDGKLTNEQIGRYSRQLILPELGVKGQQRLLSSKVLIVGAGGLGCPAAIYLAAAGVGTVGVVDYDEVEVSNLHRQILHTEHRLGRSKAESVALSCRNLNSSLRFKTHRVQLSSENALSIIEEYDVVLDCTDNVATRYLLSDACVLAARPLVSGSALRFEGQLTVYNYKGGPCYRCLYPKPPPPETVTNCSDGGVLGVVPGIIGCYQALEAIKIAADMGTCLSERLMLFDGMDGTTRTIRLRRRQPSCPVCGDTPTIRELVDYEQFCGARAADKDQEKDVLAASSRMSAKFKSFVYQHTNLHCSPHDLQFKSFVYQHTNLHCSPHDLQFKSFVYQHTNLHCSPHDLQFKSFVYQHTNLHCSPHDLQFKSFVYQHTNLHCSPHDLQFKSFVYQHTNLHCSPHDLQFKSFVYQHTNLHCSPHDLQFKSFVYQHTNLHCSPHDLQFKSFVYQHTNLHCSPHDLQFKSFVYQHTNLHCSPHDLQFKSFVYQHTNLHCSPHDLQFKSFVYQHTNLHCSPHDLQFKSFVYQHTNLHCSLHDLQFKSFVYQHTNLHCSLHDLQFKSFVYQHTNLHCSLHDLQFKSFVYQHTNLHCSLHDLQFKSFVYQHTNLHCSLHDLQFKSFAYRQVAENGERHVLVDVRQPVEMDICRLPYPALSILASQHTAVYDRLS